MSPDRRARNWIVAGSVLLIAAILGSISLIFIGVETGPLGFAVGLIMAAIPVPFYVALTLWLDRLEPEPPLLLFLAFVWGAAIAIFFAFVFNSTIHATLALIGGAAAGSLSSIISAPFVEESAKGLALLLLCWWQRDEFDNVTDGILYATMIGLGFAMTENVQYYGRAVAHEVNAGPFALFFVRGMMGPFCHPLFTSMTGIGIGYGRESNRTEVKLIAPILGLAAAMVLHFIWNLSTGFGPFFFVTYLFVMVPAFLGVIVVGLFSLRRESRVIRLHLSSLAASGLLSENDLEVLTSIRKRIQACAGALSTGGIAACLKRREFHRVATDLAFHSWRRSRGERNETTLDYESHVAGAVSAIRRLREELAMEPCRPISPAPALGTLLCTSGKNAGERYPIDARGLEIGRDPSSANLVIRDRRVSKRHVWIGMRNGGFVAVDHGSMNGTFVNEPSTRVRETRLTPGDILIISNDVARFQLLA